MGLGLDFHFKSWKWCQWLALFGLIQVIGVMFSFPYVYLFRINLRITLLVFATLLIVLYNFLYVIGLFVDYEKKRYYITMAIPYGLMIIDVLFFYFLRRAANAVIVGYSSYLYLALSYTVYCITLIICYNKIEFVYEDLSERELFELGVIDTDPDKVIGGKSVSERTKQSKMFGN